MAFDLDGTLVDSRQDLADSANAMLASYKVGPLPVDDVVAMVGDGARALVERALTAAGLPTDDPAALARFLDIYNQRLLVNTRPYAGVPEVLERVSGRATLALLTNKPESMSRQLLEAFDLARHFRWTIGGDSAFPRKPDPAALRYLMEAAGTTPQRTLMVGDSMVDVETGRRAGTSICVAGYGFGQSRGPMSTLPTEQTAPTPADLLPILESFLGPEP